MRKMLIGLVLLLGSQSACNRHGPRFRPAAPPYQPPVADSGGGREYVQGRPTPAAPPVAKAPPAQTWFPRSRRIEPRWQYIVIHHSATETGGARAFDQFHRGKGWDELGYHFVIGNGTSTPDGMIEVGPRWEKQKHGAHCKTPGNFFNDHGIGICLVGDFTDNRPTRKQLTSLYHLVRFLCYACGIPPDRISTHGALTRHTVCPGPNFPIQPLRNAIRATGSVASARR